MEQTKRHELELLAQAHQNALELAKQEVEQTYCAEIDTLKQENERELMAVRVELERALEICQGKEREAEIKKDEHQQEMRLKQKFIEKLTEDLNQLKLSCEELKTETESRVKELKRARHELQVEFKNKETMLQQRVEEEISHMEVENAQRRQALVNEFKHAQDVLKEKVWEAEEALRQMHEKYLSREARECDLVLIGELRADVAARQEQLRILEDEKRYLQMELVNRDNNFSKVFNSNINVGCINPLNANTKVCF